MTTKNSLTLAFVLACACATADDMQKLCDDGWRAMMATWHEKTGLVYGCPPERVRSSKDCVNGVCGRFKCCWSFEG